VIEPALARRIRLLALDVDGVLTDNAIYLGPVAGERVELKRFDIQDGLGLGLLRGSGIQVAWISGRTSEATALRATELRIPTLIQDAGARKLPALTALLEEMGIEWSAVAYVGDDLADLPVLSRVGLPIAVANAVAEVKAAARVVTSRRGGEGAVREVVEALLKARGEWDAALAGYLATRGGP
jgi:3-deoxy-D-manno-octulosonate 8-phosphate phosphatase (KDO 8-P phosphatase)